MAVQGVKTIDCLYLEPQRAAAFLIVDSGEAAFVDNNTVHALPRLLATLEANLIDPAQVRYLIITHVHLDHAGGTAALLKRCPNAQVLCHPVAARHVIDPSKLTASVKRVYGIEAFRKLYGTIRAIPAERVEAIADGEQRVLGGRTLTFYHTPGHANHHIAVFDPTSGGVFAGDTLGVARPALQYGHRPFVLWSCPPTEFSPNAAHETVRRLLGLGAERAYLTHYGTLAPLAQAGETLVKSLEAMEKALQEAMAANLDGDDLPEFCEDRVRTALYEIARECGINLTADDLRWMESDIHMNAMGLAYLVGKQQRV